MFYQIVFAWIYSHLFEYVAHRYFLHNNKRFKSSFKNHFANHHYISRKNAMYDENYESVLSSKFEMYSLLITAIIHAPIGLLFPYSYLTLLTSLFVYYIIHKKAHTNVSWGRKWLPWHYAHHMGKNQHINWGVRLPIVDLLFGTSNFRKAKASANE